MESPVRHLKGLNVRTDRRHDRRALEPDEMRRLLVTTAAAPKRYGATGPQRAIVDTPVDASIDTSGFLCLFAVVADWHRAGSGVEQAHKS
jgi:hypothetical protein